MKAIVCGGRNIGRANHHSSDTAQEIARASAERRLVSAKLSELHAERSFSLIIGGNEGGAERLGTHWAEINRVPLKIVERKHRETTPLRNARMLQENAPDLVIAFGGGESTDALLADAEKAGVAVIRIDVSVAAAASRESNEQPGSRFPL